MDVKFTDNEAGTLGRVMAKETFEDEFFELLVDDGLVYDFAEKFSRLRGEFMLAGDLEDVERADTASVREDKAVVKFIREVFKRADSLLVRADRKEH